MSSSGNSVINPVVVNKTKNVVSVHQICEGEIVKYTLAVGESKNIKNTGISNLEVYKISKSKEGKMLWSGAVPSNSNLEIRNKKNTVTVYVADQPVPQCCLGGSGCSIAIWVVLGVAALILIIWFIWWLMNSKKKR